MSLSHASAEEIGVGDVIVGERPDAIIDIIDATNIERNLYLTAQLLELERPMVIALNFMDEVEKHGDHIDVAGLSKALGVPVIPITARSGENIQTLLEAAHRQMHVGVTIEPDDLYDGFTHQIHHKVGELIHDKAYAAHIPAHWASIKLIEGDALVEKALGLSQRERDELEAVCREYEGAYDLGDRETLIADARYQFIQTVVAQCVRRGRPLGAPTLSDRIDAIVTHKVLAIPVFLLMMLCMFALTFGPGQMLADGVDALIGGWFAGGVRSLLAAAGTAPWVEALLVWAACSPSCPRSPFYFCSCPSWRIQATWPGRPSLWTGCCGASACPARRLSPCSWASAAPSRQSWEPAPWRTRRTAA